MEEERKRALQEYNKKVFHLSLRTGFEPVREDPNGFQVHRLNHSAIAATLYLARSLKLLHLSLQLIYKPLIWGPISLGVPPSSTMMGIGYLQIIGKARKVKGQIGSY